MQNFLAFMLFQEFSPEAEAASGAAATGILILWLGIIVLMIAAMWKVFTKAGEPGWAAIIPIYNIYIMLKIAGKPGWWLLLLFVPIVNFVVMIMVYVAFAEAFGKGVGFALGLAFLAPIFFPMLAWGDSRYSGVAKLATA